MNEKEAWLYIAEAYATPRPNRNDKQNYLTAYGICAAICEAPVHGVIACTMDDKVRNDLEDGKAFFCKYNEAGDAFRAEYCRKQASLL